MSLNYGSAITGSADVFQSTAAPFIMMALPYIRGSGPDGAAADRGGGLYGEIAHQERWTERFYANSLIRRKNASCRSENPKLTKTNAVYAPAKLQTCIRKLMPIVARRESVCESVFQHVDAHHPAPESTGDHCLDQYVISNPEDRLEKPQSGQEGHGREIPCRLGKQRDEDTAAGPLIPEIFVMGNFRLKRLLYRPINNFPVDQCVTLIDGRKFGEEFDRQSPRRILDIVSRLISENVDRESLTPAGKRDRRGVDHPKDTRSIP